LLTSNNVGITGGAGTNSGSDTLTISPGGGGGGGEYSDTNSCSSNSNVVSGRGGNATAFSGGTGGGGKMSGLGASSSAATQGDDNGGEGGEAGNGHCGGVHTTTGGVGNPGGWDQYGSANQGGYNQTANRANSGTGGVIWLIVGGNLTIGSGGIVDVRGSDNTNYVTRTAGGIYGGGGASAGGVAILLYKTSYTNSGSILTAGGQYLLTNDAGTGGTGGAGASTVIQVV